MFHEKIIIYIFNGMYFEKICSFLLYHHYYNKSCSLFLSLFSTAHSLSRMFPMLSSEAVPFIAARCVQALKIASNPAQAQGILK